MDSWAFELLLSRIRRLPVEKSQFARIVWCWLTYYFVEITNVYPFYNYITLQFMRILAYTIRRTFSNSQTIPLSLLFPYQFTLLPSKFDLHDLRYSQLPFSRQLAKPQKQHIQFILQRWQNMLNKYPHQTQSDKQFILTCLKVKCRQLRQILKQSSIQLQFKFNTHDIVKSSGYLEIHPEGLISLREEDLKYVHEYDFRREKERVFVKLREKKSRLSQQEQLKQDLNKQFSNHGEQIRQKLEEMKVSRHAVIADKFIKKLMSMGRPKQKRAGFQSYYIVEQIKGTMQCKMKYEGLTYFDNQLQFDSKWLYHVTNLQSEDIKKYRKRSLFDFQYWNRGNFFPIKDFTASLPS